MRKLLPLLVIFTAVLFLYYPVLSTYFSQDDFFIFKISQTDGSLAGFLNLFGFHPFQERGIAFYRPVFREGLHNILYSLFGLNPLPWRILLLVIHGINIILVLYLTEKIFKKKRLAFFVSFFFGVNASNLASLYYLAGGIEILGATMFILLTLFFFISYLNTKKTVFKVLTLMTFVLALGSYEIAVVTPILLVGLVWVILPFRESWTKISSLWPLFLILGIYLYFNVTRIGFSSSEQQYQMVINLKTTLNSLAWYTAWALGLPEMLVDFVLPGFKLNPSLMRYWGSYFVIIFPAFILAVLIIGYSILYLFFKSRIVYLSKIFWFFLIWFILSLSPVILLPSHRSTHYLALAQVGMWGMIGFVVFNAYWTMKKNSPRFAFWFLGTFFLSLIILSVASIKLGETTFWAINRGKLAEKLIKEIGSKYPSLPKGAAIYFTNDPIYPFVAKEWGGTSKQAAFALNGADALKLFYRDPNLQVFYEDLGKIPPDFPPEKVYSLVAQVK